MGRLRAGAGLAVCVAVLACVGASPAQGAFGIAAFDGAVSDSVGGAFTQAGGHPDTASTVFDLNTTTMEVSGFEFVVPDGGNMRDIRVDVPPGLVGNPAAVGRCPKSLRIATGKQARAATFDPNEFCPLSSIVGVASVTLFGDILSGFFLQRYRFIAPVFNLEPPPGVAAQFGFGWSDEKVFLDASVRTDGDYGLRISSRNANEIKSVLASKVTLWGNPTDHSHDVQRCATYYHPVIPIGEPFPESGVEPVCIDPDGQNRPWLLPNAANVASKAFMSNPTACTPAGVGLETRLRIEPWSSASAPDEASFVSHLPPGLPLPVDQWGPAQGPDGCENVPFDPSVNIQADTAKADSPAALAVDLSFPQDGLSNPDGIATAHLKRATVTLPEGWSVSPSAADGLQGCSDAQARVGTTLGAGCPDASKIGTVTATTPLLEEELEGGVYVGTQESDDPLSGRMFRIFIALNSEERGVHVKLPGQIRIDPDTGRIETTFDNNPQVPVDKISLRLMGGARAPLASPLDCGTKQATTVLEAWSGAVATRTNDLAVECPGAGPLAPTFTAGMTSNLAGRHSTFVLRANRPDNQQVMNGLALRMPPGLLAKLKGVPRCPDAAANAGTCTQTSRVGTATVGAGPGTNPFYIQGGVYLTGPYKKGPFGLSVSVHAKAGPFDLGVTTVRQQLIVDPIDAHVDVVSDPLPTILKGVPIRLRSLNVDVDRNDFILNPTSCKTRTILAAFSSPSGSIFNTSAPFGVANCAALPLKPKLSIALTGKGQTGDGKHPGVKARVVQRAGHANLKRVQVKLPLSLALDPDNAQALCEFADGTKVDPTCPKGSIVGRARAVTPLLDRPVSAPVYFVKNVRIDPKTKRPIRTLPMLVIPLRGENDIKLNIKGTSNVSKDHLVNTLDLLPDAPVSRFDLTIDGGKNGILVINNGICRKKQIANTEIDGQNGKHSDRNTTLTTPNCKTKKNKRR